MVGRGGLWRAEYFLGSSTICCRGHDSIVVALLLLTGGGGRSGPVVPSGGHRGGEDATCGVFGAREASSQGRRECCHWAW